MRTPQFWIANPQFFSDRVNFVIATKGSVAFVGKRARAILLDLDPGLAVPPPTSLDATFREEIGRYQTAAKLISLFGLLALALASVDPVRVMRAD